MLKVINFKEGVAVRASSKTEGRSIIMVGATSYSNVGGALFGSSRRAIINLPSELAESLDLKDGDDINAKLKGHGLNAMEIIRKESITPAYEGQKPKVNPSTNEVVKDSAGNPIYMEDKAFDLGTEKDELVKSAGQSQATAEATTAEAGDLADA